MISMFGRKAGRNEKKRKKNGPPSLRVDTKLRQTFCWVFSLLLLFLLCHARTHALAHQQKTQIESVSERASTHGWVQKRPLFKNARSSTTLLSLVESAAEEKEHTTYQ